MSAACTTCREPCRAPAELASELHALAHKQQVVLDRWGSVLAPRPPTTTAEPLMLQSAIVALQPELLHRLAFELGGDCPRCAQAKAAQRTQRPAACAYRTAETDAEGRRVTAPGAGQPQPACTACRAGVGELCLSDPRRAAPGAAPPSATTHPGWPPILPPPGESTTARSRLTGTTEERRRLAFHGELEAVRTRTAAPLVPCGESDYCDDDEGIPYCPVHVADLKSGRCPVMTTGSPPGDGPSPGSTSPTYGTAAEQPVGEAAGPAAVSLSDRHGGPG